VDTKRGEVIFTIRKELIPHLTELKQNFTSYQLMNIPNLKSVYAIRIYGLLCQYLKIGSRKFELLDFKSKVGAPSKYKYNDIKKRVIIPAQKQLEENTNIRFEFEEIKTGRSITALQFIIFKNTRSSNSPQTEMAFLKEYFEDTENDNAAFTDELFETLKKIGITKERAVKYLAQGFNIIEDEIERKGVAESGITLGDYYNEKLELLQQSPSQKNPAGFYIKAIKQNWRSAVVVKKTVDKKLAKSRGDAKRNLIALEKKIEILVNQKRIKDNEICKAMFSDESIIKQTYDAVVFETKEGIIKGRMLSLKSLPLVEQYEKQPSLQMYMNAKLKDTYSDKFTASKEIQNEIDKVKGQIQILKKENRGLKN
jgi:hypothetical protein